MFRVTLCVRGSKFRPAEDIDKVGMGDVVRFEPEPTNEYDANAIKILTSSPRYEGELWIGYVPRESTAPVHRLLRLINCLDGPITQHGAVTWLKEFPDSKTDVKIGITIDGVALEGEIRRFFRNETIVDLTEVTEPAPAS